MAIDGWWVWSVVRVGGVANQTEDIYEVSAYSGHPVMRGAVHPVRIMVVRPRVEEAFGFASVQVLDFADLYAGKLAAALSRQHPRDLFDVGLLLEDERADQVLWRTFLVYMTCSPKPAWEMLAPRVPADFAATFDAHFKGMTAEPIEVEALLNIHERLLVILPQKRRSQK